MPSVAFFRGILVIATVVTEDFVEVAFIAVTSCGTMAAITGLVTAPTHSLTAVREILVTTAADTSAILTVMVALGTLAGQGAVTLLTLWITLLACLADVFVIMVDGRKEACWTGLIWRQTFCDIAKLVDNGTVTVLAAIGPHRVEGTSAAGSSALPHTVCMAGQAHTKLRRILGHGTRGDTERSIFCVFAGCTVVVSRSGTAN